MEMKALRAMLEERRSSSLARQNKSARPELRQGIPSRGWLHVPKVPLGF
jgi:hypothetical protein